MPDIFETLRRVSESARTNPGDPGNTPVGTPNSDTGLPPDVEAQIQSARIIEDLVQIYGSPQQNNRMSNDREQSPSSRTNNLLKNSGVSLPKAAIVDGLLTPINGLYGIVMRADPGAISSTDFRSTPLREVVQRQTSSVWSSIITSARTGVSALADPLSLVSDDETEATPPPETACSVLDIPRYVVFIFANSSPQTPIPVITQAGEVLTYKSDLSYPRAILTNIYVRKEGILQPGTLIRVQYDGQDNKSKPVISEIVENDPIFTRLVMNSMKDRSALLATTACSTDSALSGISHPSGDAISGEDAAVNLHNAYIQLERQVGVNMIDKTALYTALFSALGDAKLALGVLANAKHESGFNSNVVSRVATESSIGLWQFNVQNPGYFSKPNSQVRERAKILPESIRIPEDQRVVPYFAGGLLLKSQNLAAVTPNAYDGTQDLRPLYLVASNPTTQTAFVVLSVKNMLSTISYNPDEITASEWATWFQIYFEQPGSIKPRGPTASLLSSELGIVV